jgi:hypothetical protein
MYLNCILPFNAVSSSDNVLVVNEGASANVHTLVSILLQDSCLPRVLAC